jgi:hypothetical protein
MPQKELQPARSSSDLLRAAEGLLQETRRQWYIHVLMTDEGLITRERRGSGICQHGSRRKSKARSAKEAPYASMAGSRSIAAECVMLPTVYRARGGRRNARIGGGSAMRARRHESIGARRAEAARHMSVR